MWMYHKVLAYPVNIKKRDLKMAKLILTQYGGPQGELAAALRYLNQSYTMPDDKGKALLVDIGTEELGHVEMLCAMLLQLTKGATSEDFKAAGMADYYAEHRLDLFPQSATGNSFTTDYINATGDVIANLTENMAAEEKARSVYENLLDLATDIEVIKPLRFLWQREIVHFERFKQLRDYYQKELKIDR